MPLDEFQKVITAVLSANRGAESPFAGGAVIQQHGFRLSEDQDIFTGREFNSIVERDIEALRHAGFRTFRQKDFHGFQEHLVTGPAGRTTVQWTQALGSEFYEPVPDPLFGYRLHFADLAVNKALAAGSRIAKRDFVDLWMLDRHVIPLWRIICAAPGKDPDFSPLSLVEHMSRNWHFARTRTGGTSDRFEVTYDISLGDMVPPLRETICGTAAILDGIPHELYGCLQVDDGGQPMLSRETNHEVGQWIYPKRNGCMPSFSGMDGEMIAGLIAEYGRDGSRYTMGNPQAPTGMDDGGGVDP